MLKKISLLTVLMLSVTACGNLSYGDKEFVPTRSVSDMQYESNRIKADERAERAEARKERREILMDEADAYHRAVSGQKVYILR